MNQAEPSERTPRALVGAALALLRESGNQPVQLEASGEAAGLLHGVIPFHSGSKDCALRALSRADLEPDEEGR